MGKACQGEQDVFMNDHKKTPPSQDGAGFADESSSVD
jgi:hypothetical protein